MIFSHDRGHRTMLTRLGVWVYFDTMKPVDYKRPCKKCGVPPTREGYDACLGHIEGAESACCGHGIEGKKVVF